MESYKYRRIAWGGSGDWASSIYNGIDTVEANGDLLIPGRRGGLGRYVRRNGKVVVSELEIYSFRYNLANELYYGPFFEKDDYEWWLDSSNNTFYNNCDYFIEYYPAYGGSVKYNLIMDVTNYWTYDRPLAAFGGWYPSTGLTNFIKKNYGDYFGDITNGKWHITHIFPTGLTNTTPINNGVYAINSRRFKTTGFIHMMKGITPPNDMNEESKTIIV